MNKNIALMEILYWCILGKKKKEEEEEMNWEYLTLPDFHLRLTGASTYAQRKCPQVRWHSYQKSQLKVLTSSNLLIINIIFKKV